MRRFLLLVAALAGCGPVEAESKGDDVPDWARQAILGGTVDTGDPEVFGLLMQGNNGAGAGCTATLIDRRTLLTAAHCADPRTLGATAVQIFAHNKYNENQVAFSDLIRVVETRLHPLWDTTSNEGDVAMLLLQTAPTGVTPKPWNTASIDSFTGRTIRAVGYGANVGGTNPTGGGIKRQVSLTFRQMFTDAFFLGDGQSKGVCHGDSGGPSFHTFSDGVERIVGVHSFTTNQNCLYGADMRVDFYAPFVRQWLAEKEAPSCDEDGRCATGCTTPDIDCVCKADGQCTAMCPNLAKDPDCPPDCAMNGVCSLQACPVRDSDCVDDGMACGSPLQCPGRTCMGDAQHSQSYCSRQCSGGQQCQAGMECDAQLGACRYPYVAETPVGEICTPLRSFCALNSLCAGPTPDYAYCSWPCQAPADCTEPNATCSVSFDGRKYCQLPPRPAVKLTGLGIVERDAASCSMAPGLLPALAALLLLRRRRR